jgi:multisubunit Na+/H+ antiporter MnhG subunit
MKSAKKRIIANVMAIMLSFCMVVMLLPITVFAAETVAASAITVTAPVAGENPVENASESSPGFSVLSVSWGTGTNADDFQESMVQLVFAEGDAYTVRVLIGAANGYEFNTEASYYDSAKTVFNSNAVDVVVEDANSAFVYIRFTAVGAAAEPDEPTTAVIPNSSYPITITAPVGGATIGNATVGSNNYFTVASTQWAEHGSQTF